MEAPLLDLLQSTVTVATVAGRDSYNKKTYNEVDTDTVSASSTDNSFNDSGSGFPALSAGDLIQVAGFTDSANNGEFRVVSRTAAKVIVTDDTTLVTEAAGDDVTVTPAFKARIRFGNVGVYGPDGTEVTSSAQVWMDGDVNVKTEDKITLPDSTTPEILRVDRPQDENGDIDHTKLFLR